MLVTKSLAITLLLSSLGISSGLSISCSVFAAMTKANDELLVRGEYIALAADCGACHNSPISKTSTNGDPINNVPTPFGGGYAINTPIGDIIASNITPSKKYGIGRYSEKDFSNAVRKGIAKDGHYLYPVMPYTAYHGMTDDDIHALYFYFIHGVKPTEFALADKTSLRFPFNIRQLMWGWDLLFRNDTQFVKQAALSEEQNRGKYLVDVLAHCGTCHTPRNILMAETSDKYLSGGSLGSWFAPNITSDPQSGIGSWHKDDIVTYLKTGHLPKKADAAGEMGKAVGDSFRYLSDQDLNAIASWIKVVPAIQSPVANQLPGAIAQAKDINLIVTGQGTQVSLADSHTEDGAKLYQAACSSCHGRQGQGTTDNFYPSLTRNSTVSAARPNNLVMTIVGGVDRQGQDFEAAMPAFNQQLTDRQIAAVSNYVRLYFANIADNLTVNDVKKIRVGEEPSFIIRYINCFIGGGFILFIAILLCIFRRYRSAKR